MSTTGAEEENAPLLSRIDGQSARVRPESERIELNLLPIQGKPPADPATPPQINAKTDAQMRLYIEDQLVYQVQKDFENVKLPEQLMRELASRTVEHLQIELDLNIERFNTEKRPLNVEFMSDRISMLAFRYDRFLRSLKEVEDREYNELKKKDRQENLAMLTLNRVVTGDYSDGKKLPPNLVEHFLQVGMEQHLLVMRKYVLGEAEAMGITVTFKDLTVSRNVPNMMSPVPQNSKDARDERRKRLRKLQEVLRPRGPQTVWSATANTLFGSCFAVADRMQSHGPRKKEIQLLKSLSGVLKPAKATLLLGAPHSGKTQLLHALSNQTKTKGPIKVTGEVRYNGYSYKDVHATNFCLMVEQIDVHIPVLTVRETVEFAFMCRNQAKLHGKGDPVKEKVSKLLKSRVDLILATLGLTRVADTIIGNEAIKGISGGEMRRVTLAEMMVVGAKVFLLDEISTGLDSAATFDITKSIRSLCRVFNNTALVSLLQPPPETVDLFDDVMLMSSGQIVYHGARARLAEWLTSISFAPDPNMDLADFVIEVSVKQRERLFQAYVESEEVAEEKAILARPPESFHLKTQFPDNKMLVETEALLVKAERYGSRTHRLFLTVFNRQLKVILRNKAFILARIVQNVVMGLLLGALFFSIPFNQYYLVAMILSQLLSMSGFSTMALVGGVVASRAVFYKQNKQAFFPAFVYVISDYLVGLPFSLMDAFLLGSITYFMAGLSLTDNGRPYFIFLIIFISFGVCMATIIRSFGYVARDQNIAFSLAVFFNVFGLIFSGAVATPSVIPPYFIWIYWGFSPFAWAYRSALQNEFYSSKYEAQCDSGCPNNNEGQCVWYCGEDANCPTPYPQMSCGQYFLTARQVATNPYFLWLGIGLLWCYTLLAILLSVLALKYVRWDSAALSPIQADAVAEVREVIEAGNIDPSASLAGMQPTDGTASVTGVSADGFKDPEAQHHDDPQLAAAAKQLVTQKTFTPRPLIWKDIVYTIELVAKGGRKHRDEPAEQIDLLKHVNGFAKPHSMTALMGSSGAGKTTLLDCLSYRKTVGKITGAVMLGGKQVIPFQFKKSVGYVEQFGVHSAKATVRESLEFSARLRLGKEYTDAERAQTVEQVLDVLELRPVEDQLVGTLGDSDGLSFEENKRLTIAVELVASPAVLFADEPTSGLTSKEARITMRALKRVADSGRPVVCTIHQPSLTIFEMFDRLLLLKRGGEVVYFGELGQHAHNLVEYFEGIPGVGVLPQGLNPATWMLEVIGAGVGRADNKSAMDFAEIYRSSDLRMRNDAELEQLIEDFNAGEHSKSPSRDDEDPMINHVSSDASPSEHIFDDERQTILSQQAQDETEGDKEEDSTSLEATYKRSFTTQFRSLSRRNFIEYWRTPSYSLLRWIVMLIFALVAGLTFLQQQMADAAGVQSRVGVINLLLLLTANYNSATIVPFAFSRKALFYREKASGMYASFLYAITLQWVEEPYILIEVFLSVVVFYFLVGMAPTASAFFYYVFLMYFFVSFATYLGLMWAAAMGSQGAASLISSLFIQLMVLFSGVALPGNVMQSWLLGFYYISPVRWAMEGLLASQFREYTQVICNTSGNVYTWSNGSLPNANCPSSNGTVVSFYLGDVNLNACCNPLPNRPISAKAYVFTGFTYPDGRTTTAWLGGTNGYQIDWLGFDYLFVIMVGIIVRIAAILLTQYVSHQLR